MNNKKLKLDFINKEAIKIQIRSKKIKETLENCSSKTLKKRLKNELQYLNNRNLEIIDSIKIYKNKRIKGLTNLDFIVDICSINPLL